MKIFTHLHFFNGGKEAEKRARERHKEEEKQKIEAERKAQEERQKQAENEATTALHPTRENYNSAATLIQAIPNGNHTCLLN